MSRVVLADLRLSARSLMRTPALTLALVVSVALGIGANASVLGYIRGSITRHVLLPDASRIVSVFTRSAEAAPGPVSYEQYLSVKAGTTAFETAGAARETQAAVTIAERPTVMAVAEVTPELAELLRLPLDKGIVISARVWRNEYGARSGIEGTAIRVAGVDSTIGGVAPEWLEGLYMGRAVDLWSPWTDASAARVDRRSRTLWVLARLRRGTTASQAQAAVDASGTKTDAIAVIPYTGVAPEAAGGMSRIARLLPVASAAVFLIACANVMAFLLSRASARAQEMSVRVALGASRRQLARQLLSDSLLVSVAGAAVGALLAYWTAQIIPALFFDQDAERLLFAPDVAGIAGASIACAAVTIGCGLIPFLEIRHDDPAAVLSRESSGPSRGMRRLRAGLVVAVMACCSVLVIFTALLVEEFHHALRTHAGNRLGRTLLATIQLPPLRRFERPDLGREYFRRAETSVASLPGIASAAWTAALPGASLPAVPVRIEPPHLPHRDVTLDVAAFTPQSLPLITLPPVAGRMFAGRDTPDACKVIVVNEQAATALFDGDPIGRSIEDPSGERVEIVGVVAMRRRPTDATPIRPTAFYNADQTAPPLNRTGPAIFRVPVLPESSPAIVGANVVSANYFEVSGMTLISGKGLPAAAPRPGCRTAVINAQAAELYFGGKAEDGALIDEAGVRTTISGVVRSSLLGTAQRQDAAAIYFPAAQDFVYRMTLVLATTVPDEALRAMVQTTLESALEREPGSLAVTTLEAHLSRTALAPERIATVLVGASAATALTLGVLGLFGAMSESARLRRREIALRIALGAQRWHVTRQLVSEGFRLAAAGTLAGAIGAAIVAAWLGRAAPERGVGSVWLWLASPLLLLAAVTLASLIPLRRALAVDPIASIREP